MPNITVGTKVINKHGEAGAITSVGSRLDVNFGGSTITYQSDAFAKGYLRFADEDSQKEFESEMAKAEEEEKKIVEARRAKAIEDNKKYLEKAKKLAEKEAEKKAASDKRAKKRNEGKKSGPVRPYIDARRRLGKKAIFLVCQNDNYQVEASGGYIWAPNHKLMGGRNLASHAEVEFVKEGDIIFHHFDNHIYAVSIAKKDCELKSPGTGHPKFGVPGHYVELSYQFLENPADTSGLKAEKIAYGSMTYGPFEKTGKNKEGFYLSELADELALVFIDAAIAANPTDTRLQDIKNKI